MGGPPPPPPRFARPPDAATVVVSLCAAALFGAPGILSVLAAARRAAGHRYPGVLGPALLAVFLLSMSVLALVPLICPRPRITHSPNGITVRPARLVGIATTTAWIGFGLILAAFTAAAFGEHSTPSQRHLALAVAVPGWCGIAMVAYFRNFGAAARLRGRDLVTLRPQGITFSDKGIRADLPWEQITDVRVGPSGIRGRRLGVAQLYLDTARGGNNPLMVDRYLHLGGSWLLDTIRYYWHDPAARSALNQAL